MIGDFGGIDFSKLGGAGGFGAGGDEDDLDEAEDDDEMPPLEGEDEAPAAGKAAPVVEDVTEAKA